MRVHTEELPVPPFEEYCLTRPAETDSAKWARHRDWQTIVARHLNDKASHARGALEPIGPDSTDLLLDLVAYVDTRHDYEDNHCQPVAPDNCSPYCHACALLRGVRDDILTVARAEAEARAWGPS